MSARRNLQQRRRRVMLAKRRQALRTILHCATVDRWVLRTTFNTINTQASLARMFNADYYEPTTLRGVLPGSPLAVGAGQAGQTLTIRVGR